ncbi:unnamed protein product [Discula destructiva]
MRLTTATTLVAAATKVAATPDDAAAAQRPLSYEQAEAQSTNPLTRDFRRKVMHWLGEWHVPGLAVGVVDGDETWTQGYGIATYPSTPVTSKTLFYGASTSKAFTAAALSIMIASSNYTVPSLPGTTATLDWTTPIASLIPEDFVLMDDPWATTHITLEDALSHRTGLPRHDNFNSHWLPDDDDDDDESGEKTPGVDETHTNNKEKKRAATPRDVTRSLRYLPMNAPPRTKWQYCNQMFIVASHAIQTLTGGRWLGDLLREWLWAPLGMDATYFSLPDALAAPEHFAAGYSWRRDGEEAAFVRIPYMPLDEVSGAGSVVSCAADYVKWIRMLLREQGPVPAAGHAALKTPRMYVDPASVLASYGNATARKKALPYDAPLGYAFGWNVGSYRGHSFWTHSGGMHAYGAEVFVFPGLDFGVVTFGNTAGTSNYVGLFAVWQLVDDRLGVPEEERFDWEAQFRGYDEESDGLTANAINKTYPDRPSKPIARALPLAAYQGTYYHPAYLNFTLNLTSATTLSAVRSDATWPTFNDFEHVSGEYWMMFQRYQFGDRNGPATSYSPAQFKVGPNGQVAAMGITWLQPNADGEDTVEGLVWFDKIE